MEIVGETLIPASIDKVWQGLNSPEVLKASIPGCEALERKSPTELTARVVAKVEDQIGHHSWVQVVRAPARALGRSQAGFGEMTAPAPSIASIVSSRTPARRRISRECWPRRGARSV